MELTKNDLGTKGKFGIYYAKGAYMTFLDVPDNLKPYFKSGMKLPELWPFNQNQKIELCGVNKNKEGIFPTEFIVEQAEEGKQLILRFSKLSKTNENKAENI